MSNKCLYKPLKGDVRVVDGNHVMYLRNKTLRGAFSGEYFYADDKASERLVVCNDYVEGEKFVKCASAKNGLVGLEFVPIRKKVWRVAGSMFVSDLDLKTVGGVEIRERKAKSEDEVFAKKVYEVVGEDLNGAGKFVRMFNAREDAEKYCHGYRVRKWLKMNDK